MSRIFSMPAKPFIGFDMPVAPMISPARWRCRRSPFMAGFSEPNRYSADTACCHIRNDEAPQTLPTSAMARMAVT
ncbi:hypothetical protein D9M68_786710 [compost metagenome]